MMQIRGEQTQIIDKNSDLEPLDMNMNIYENYLRTTIVRMRSISNVNVIDIWTQMNLCGSLICTAALQSSLSIFIMFTVRFMILSKKLKHFDHTIRAMWRYQQLQIQSM